nr:hypothetical protein [Tanacetum cinerariifolium]
MADNRIMAQMLQAPIEGYEDAIVVPPINALSRSRHLSIPFSQTNSPEDKTHITISVSSIKSHPHLDIWRTSAINFDLERSRIKVYQSILSPSKTTYLRNEITNFLQKSNETFNEAWERFKDLLRQCPHHGFSELHQLDTFYNTLTPNDQDALDSAAELHQLDTFYNALNPNDQDVLDLAAGGNFLHKIPRECLSIIESKSKVRYSRSGVTDVRANANAPLSSSSHSNSFDLQQI